MMPRHKEIIPSERIEKSILLLRGQKVMLDADLARIYGVTTKRLNEQVKRNARRFPADFAFRLSKVESKRLAGQRARPGASGNRSQIATGYPKHRNPRFLPYAFTEHGVEPALAFEQSEAVERLERAAVLNIEPLNLELLNRRYAQNEWNDWNGYFLDDRDPGQKIFSSV